MDIASIDGSAYVQGDATVENAAGLPDRRIILHDDTPVYRFIDAAGFDNTAIHRIRVARPVRFSCETVLKYKPTGEILLKPTSLTDLLLSLEEKELKNYRLVLDTEDRELLSETIQQLLYLDIDMEVMLMKEEREVRRMDLFIWSFRELESILTAAGERIRHCPGVASAEEHREKIMHVLSDMEATLKTMHMREIKVAVMALKKSGKSAVVNCLLGEEYTPASLETPTFTTCIYRRSKSKLISIRYGDRETFFDSPGEVKKYMMDLFKKMHRGEKGAFAAGDMEIDYVPSNDCLCNYTVIDTPGPDLAGTDHREIAYTWIREADVILFIIDYSKYLTSAEEEFLGEIKRVFEEYGKFYSLIVVVNKLDMMYMSDEKKSALRFTDFLRAKLKELGYRGFVVFGVSALQYLYSMQVTRISGCENLQTKDGKKFRENLNQSLVRYQGRDEMTTLSFLDTQIRNLRWFHGRKNATLRDLKETSGFKKLMKYINHVAMEKAHFEFFNHKMNVVEQKLADIRNNYLLPFIARCAAEGSDLDEKKNEIGRLSAEAAAAAGEIAFSEGDAGRIMRDLDLARKSLVMSLTMHIDTLVHQLEKILATLSGEKLNEFIKNGGFSPEDELSGTVDKKTIEKLYVPVLGKHAEEMNRKIAEKGNIFAGVVRAMQERVEGHSGFLRTDHRLGAPSVFSGLPASFCRVDFSPIILRLGPTCIQSLVRERLARKRGFVGWLLLIVTLGAVNTRTGRLKFNDIKLKKAILILKKELEQSAHAQVDALHEILFAHFTQHISVLKLEIAASIDSFTTDVETVCRHLTVDADVLQEEIAAKTALLKEMQNSLEQFSAVWDKIKNNEDLPAETQEE